MRGPLAEVTASVSSTRYQHDEIEGSGEIGTHFASRGHDARVEVVQRPAGAWRGVSGLQIEQLRFSALGEEAFVPATRTRSRALFTLQEFDAGLWSVSGGLRAERVRVSSSGADLLDHRARRPADRGHRHRAENIGQQRAEQQPDHHIGIGQPEVDRNAGKEFFEVGREGAEQHQRGEPTSTNSIASIYAWTRGLKHRAKLDGNAELDRFATLLETTTVATVEAGFMTKDLALLVGDQQAWLTTEGFLDKVGENLEAAMAA